VTVQVFALRAIVRATMEEKTRIACLVPLRLYCGWTFMNAGVAKLVSGWISGPQLREVVTGWLRDGRPFRFYAPFLHDVVLAHAASFARLVTLGELLVGAALLAGLFTRVAALGGIVLVGSLLLGRGDGLGGSDAMPLLVLLVTALLTGPGRALGLDAALRGRVPRWLA
jgi:thiosulfate dehydrogenase [quinone] large subunit